MFAETAVRRDSSSTPREMQRHRVDRRRETGAPFVCLDTLGVIAHTDFLSIFFSYYCGKFRLITNYSDIYVQPIIRGDRNNFPFIGIVARTNCFLCFKFYNKIGN